MHPIKSIIARRQNYISKHFEKSKYGKRLSELYNIHEGERCFIIANGPSLRVEDLDLLYEKKEITFAMNRIYKIFNKTNWRPTYYVCEDINIFNESQMQINDIPSKSKFIPINLKWYNNVRINNALYFFANYKREGRFENSFSTNIAQKMDSVGTVTFTCINIAVYMGFTKIYLLGVDHNYHITINERGETIIDNDAKDYFCDDYDSDIKDMVCHDMGNNTKAYKNAKAHCDKNGIRIYNATRGGKLEVFPRVDFDILMTER